MTKEWQAGWQGGGLPLWSMWCHSWARTWPAVTSQPLASEPPVSFQDCPFKACMEVLSLRCTDTSGGHLGHQYLG